MPESRIITPSALCSMGLRPHLMTGILCQLLRQHWCLESNIDDDVLRSRPDGAEPGDPMTDYLWRPDDTTGILIESATRWTPTMSDRKPAVIVKRNRWGVMRRGLNDMMQGNLHIDGYDRYSTFMSGSHTLFCLAQEGAEAELIAAETYRSLMHFGPVIRKSLDILRFVIVDVGALATLEDAPQKQFVVPVTVAYAHAEDWTLKPHSPRLKTISLTTNLLRP